MIKFFRKIRQNLISEGKTVNYLKYAFGEIVLVMVGILLALQVNNWNEFIKEREKEKKIISELIVNMETNHLNFEEYINGGKSFDYASDFVISILNKERVYSDSLDIMLNLAIQNRSHFTYSNAAYESLKNLGFDIISNDSLRRAIISIYEEVYPDLMNSLEWRSDNEFMINYFDQHFLPVSGDGYLIWKPYNIEIQINDNYFKSLIAKIKIQRQFYKSRVSNTMVKSQIVLEQLKNELKKTNNN